MTTTSTPSSPMNPVRRALLALVPVVLIAGLLAIGAGAAFAKPPPRPHPRPAAPAPRPSAPPQKPAQSPAPSPKPCASVQMFPGEPIPHCAGPSSTPIPVVNPPDTGHRGCAFWQVSCQVSQAINGWLGGLAKSAIKPVFSFFGKPLLTTPEIPDPRMERAQQLWFASEAIANTVFVIFIIVGGMLLMTGSAIGTAPKDVIARLVIAFTAANCSLLIIEQIIKVANALARAFLDYGAHHVDPAGAGKLIVGTLTANLASNNLLLPIIVLVAVILGVLVAVGYLTRVILIMILIAAAPLALMCHALPQTEPLARLWWRAFIGMLCIQVAQSLVFATAIAILIADNHSKTSPLMPVAGRADLVDLLLAVTLLYILARIPSWVSKAIWRGALGGSPIKSVARFLFTVLVLRRVSRSLSGGRTAGRTAGHFSGGRGGRTARPLPGPPPSSPPPPRLIPTPQRWIQPQLPFPPQPLHGRQLQIPGMPVLRQQAGHGIQLQLPHRAPPAASAASAAPGGPRWQQTELPIPVKAEQLQLPVPAARPVQQPLFTTFDPGRRPRPRIEDFPPRGPTSVTVSVPASPVRFPGLPPGRSPWREPPAADPPRKPRPQPGPTPRQASRRRPRPDDPKGQRKGEGRGEGR